MKRSLTWALWLIVVIVAREVYGSTPVTDRGCNSAAAVREAFYSGIWDGDLIACIDSSSESELPERDLMKIATYATEGRFDKARALADQLDAAKAPMPQDLRAAVRLYIRMFEELGHSGFSLGRDLPDMASNKVVRDPLAFGRPELLLPLLFSVADSENSQQLITSIQISYPKEFWPFLAQGRLAVLREKPAEAISVLSLASSLFGEKPSTRYWLARAYEQNREFDKAIREYTAFIEKDGRPCDGYISRGVLHELMGDRGKAVQDGTKAIEICQSRERVLQARQNRATSYREEGQFDKAVQDYQYIAQNGGFDERIVALMDLAGGYFGLGKYTEACASFLDLANETKANFKRRWASRYLVLTKNLATCLSVKEAVSTVEVEAYVSHIIFLLANSWRDARVTIATDGLFGLMDIHERSTPFLFGDRDQYYQLIASARPFDAGAEYESFLDLLEIFGGRAENVKAGLERLQSRGLEPLAFGIFLVDRFVLPRSPGLPKEMAGLDLQALKLSVMKDDSAQSVYLGLNRRYPSTALR